MKKSEIYSWLMYFVLIVGVILVGIYAIKPAFDYFNKSPNSIGNIIILYSILTIIVVVILYSIIYELIHVVIAKLSKYEIISVNILYFNFYKKEGKWAFRFKGYDGLTGETVVRAKDQNICSPKLILTIPNLFTALIFVGVFVGALLIDGQSIFKPLFLTTTTLIGILLIYNLAPVELDSKTDGNQLRLISHKGDIAAYNELLRLKSSEITGEKIENIKVFETITPFTAEINLLTIYNHLSKEEFDDALKIIEMMLNQTEKLSKVTKNRFVAQKLFILLYTGRFDIAKKYYDESVTSEERKQISDDLSMESIRAYILISSMLDESEMEVQYATSRVDAAFKRAEEARKETEKSLYKKTLARVKEQHPTWVLVENKKD